MADSTPTPHPLQERGRHLVASVPGSAYLIVSVQGRVQSVEGTADLPASSVGPSNGQNWIGWLPNPWRGRVRLALEELPRRGEATVSVTLPNGERVLVHLVHPPGSDQGASGTAGDGSHILVLIRKQPGLGQVELESLLQETGIGAFYVNLVQGTLVAYRPDAPAGVPRLSEGPLSTSTFFQDLDLEAYDLPTALSGLASKGGQLTAEGIYSPSLGRFVTIKAYCEEASGQTTAIQGFIKVWDEVIPDTQSGPGAALATLESDINGGQVRLRARHQHNRHAGRIIKALIEQLLGDTGRENSTFRRHCTDSVRAGGTSYPPLPYQVEVESGLEYVELRTRPRYGDRFSLDGLIHAVYESAIGEGALPQTDPLKEALPQTPADPGAVEARSRRQVKEAHHRIKNSISILTGLLQLQAAEAGQAESDVLQATVQRMMTLADLHESLYEVGSSDQESFAIKTYLNKLLSRTADTILRPGLTLNWDIEDHVLPAKTCATIGMLLTELIQNSIKHAFNLNQEGKIYTSFYAEGSQYYLAIQDNGKGMSQKPNQETSQGLGSVLISEFVSELGGTIRMEGAMGTRVNVAFPKLSPLDSPSAT